MNLLKGTIIYTLSNLTIKFGAVLLLPILTHLLNPEEYGMVGLYVTLTSFLTIILGLGFYTPLMKTQSEQKSNIATSNHVNFCAIIFLIAVYLLLLLFLYFILKSSLVIDLLGEVKLDSKLIYLAVIVSMFSAINIIMNTSFRMDENYILVAILSILSFVLFYSSAIIFIKLFNYGGLGYIYGNLLSSIIIFFISFTCYYRKLSIAFSWHNVKFLCRNGIPMVFVELSDKIIEASDRFILVRYISLSSLGVYTLALTGCKVLNVVFNSYISAILPSIYKSVESREDSNYIKVKLENAYVLVVMMVFLGQLISKEIIDMIFPASYSNLFFVFILALPAISLQYYYFLDFYFHRSEDSRFILCFTIATSIINIILNLIFVPKYGVYASLLSTYISYLIRTLVEIKFIARRYKLKFSVLNVLMGSFVLYTVPLLYHYGYYTVLLRVTLSIVLFIGIIMFYKKSRIFN